MVDTRREYGQFNLDELAEGDRIGMMRKSNGNLHYFINGLDQGVAASRWKIFLVIFNTIYYCITGYQPRLGELWIFME